MIWRDDDIGSHTDLARFARVHEIFVKYGIIHTIALICKDVESNPTLIDYIKENEIDVQLHCWEHIDFTNNHDVLSAQLKDGCDKINQLFGKSPIYLFPPWNRTDKTVESIATKLGLTVSNQKISLSQYVRTNGHVKEEVINFHYWADEDTMHLDTALQIFNKRKERCI